MTKLLGKPACSTLPLQSVFNKRSAFHSGRCWTRATGTQQHWRLAPRAHTVLSANVRAYGQVSLPVCASTCRAFIVNFHAALRAAPPRMKARIAPCLRQSTLPLRSVLNKRHWRLAPHNPAPRYVYVPLRSALNAWSTLRSGRCWTSATGA